MPFALSSGGAAAKTAATPLDDVMLAMDVVDTLRHADKLVERELSSEERDRQLKERLRQIYASQGIDVADRVLDEGVTALKEERFVYSPPAPGLSRSLALLWIERGRWGRRLFLALAIAAAACAVYLFGIKLPEEQRLARQASELSEGLPRELAAEQTRIRAIAHDDTAIKQAEALGGEGTAALKAGDANAARKKIAELKSLRGQLEQAYVLRITSRPGQPSGVFRIPEANPSARNYYVIVETVDADGRPVLVPVTSEENNRTALVSTWGLRVDQGTYDRVRADKQDDGIIQNNRVGEKKPGFLEPEYNVPTPGGAIFKW